MSFAYGAVFKACWTKDKCVDPLAPSGNQLAGDPDSWKTY
eukprot:gene16981-46903_t